MKAVAILFFFVALAAAELGEQESEEDNYYPVDPTIACALEDSEGTLIASIKYCNRFYNCNVGKPVGFNCPQGLVYNRKKEYCDWPSNVNCDDKIIADIEDPIEVEPWVPEHGHSDPSLAPEICAAKNSDGVLVAHEHCNLYYKCVHSVPFTKPCPAGLLYHAEIERCDWPRHVVCGDRINAVNA